jgi:hypothetical protein
MPGAWRQLFTVRTCEVVYKTDGDANEEAVVIVFAVPYTIDLVVGR